MTEKSKSDQKPNANDIADARGVIENLRSQLEMVSLDRKDLVNALLNAVLARGHVLLNDYSGSGIGQLIRMLGKTIDEGPAESRKTGSSSTSVPYLRIECGLKYGMKEFAYDMSRIGVASGATRRLPRVLFIEKLNLAAPKFIEELAAAMNGQPMVHGEPVMPESGNSTAVTTENRNAVGQQDGRVQYIADDGVLTVIATQRLSEDLQRGALSREYAKHFVLREDVASIPQDKEVAFIRDYSLLNKYTDPEKAVSPEDLRKATISITRLVNVEEDTVDGLLELIKVLNGDPDIDKRGRISTRALAQFIKLAKAHAFMDGRECVEWGRDIQVLAVNGLGHKLVLRQGSTARPAHLLDEAFRKLEEHGKQKWPKLQQQQKGVDLVRAMEVYRSFEDHLNSKLWGRKDDATPGTIQLILNAFFANGHILLEDYPGSGKSYMASSLADLLDDDIAESIVEVECYKRIQCTSDLMPSDVTGFNSLEGGRQEFRKGPIFAYFVLVDEINRTAPKVQSAFLEAMAEGQVTVEGRTMRLGELFFVIATQNPLDRVGTYELPAAQLDRFLFKRRLEPILEHYEARVMLDQALKGASELVKQEKGTIWSAVKRESFGRDQPGEKAFERPDRDTRKIKVSEVIATRKTILQNVGVHTDLIPKMLEVANAIRERYSDKPDGFKRGSRPSVRSMQRFIDAVKVRAFIKAAGRPMDSSELSTIKASAIDFRDLACDLLRHRVIPMKAQDPAEIDKMILEIVNGIIPESGG